MYRYLSGQYMLRLFVSLNFNSQHCRLTFRFVTMTKENEIYSFLRKSKDSNVIVYAIAIGEKKRGLVAFFFFQKIVTCFGSRKERKKERKPFVWVRPMYLDWDSDLFPFENFAIYVRMLETEKGRPVIRRETTKEKDRIEEGSPKRVLIAWSWRCSM